VKRLDFVSIFFGILERILFLPRLRKAYQKLNLDRESSPLLIMDVGANRGQSIRFFRSLFGGVVGQFIAFEPNVDLNKEIIRSASDSNLTLKNVALAESCGVKPFYFSTFVETSSLSMPDSKSRWLQIKKLILGKEFRFTEVDVQTLALDCFCSEHDVDEISILKIDVEGHELDVLQGGLQMLSEGRIKVIQIEFHDDDMRDSQEVEIDRLLRQNNFRKVGVIRHFPGNYVEALYRYSIGWGES
jgi:FkbM family methyltransferase